jgi:hypothetical protein
MALLLWHIMKCNNMPVRVVLVSFAATSKHSSLCGTGYWLNSLWHWLVCNIICGDVSRARLLGSISDGWHMMAFHVYGAGVAGHTKKMSLISHSVLQMSRFPKAEHMKTF